MNAHNITVEVIVEPGGRLERLTLKARSTVGEAVKAVGLLLEDYVTLLGEEVVMESEELADGDRLKLVRVFSGG